MKLPTNTVAAFGNIAYVKNVPMQIDPGASGIILDSLIRIYTSPYIAALREYLSNAMDSHKECGQTRPIEVSLPSALSPMLIIEDFGTGMDSYTLGQYGQFGWSTKRDSNDDIGGFGLGSKVGLALTAQYTVQAVKDGKLSLAVIGRGSNGNPEMNFVTVDEDTDLPNGVKIIIPTSEHRQFSIDKDRFLMGFPAGSVLLDGHPNTVSVHDTDYFTPIEGVGWRSDRTNSAAIGGIALVHGVVYDIEFSNLSDDFDYSLRRGLFQEVVLDLENGEVDISRSRETLVYSKRTRELLSSKLTAMVDFLSIKYGEEVDAAETAREALQLTAKAAEIGLNTHEYTWNGSPLVRPTAMNYHDSMTTPEVTKMDRIWSSARTTNTRLSREYTHYGYLLSGSGFSYIFSKSHTTLVHSAQEPVHQANGITVHAPEANALRVFAELKHGDTAIGMQYYITSMKLKNLPVEFTQAFSEVISATDMLAEVTAEREARRLAAAALRRANAALAPKAPKVAELEVRRIILTGNANGYSSSYREYVTFADNLEPDDTHVLIQRGIGGPTEAMLDLFSTKGGAYQNSELYRTLLHLQKEHKVVFLILNAGRSTKPYTSQVPNLVLAGELFTQIIEPLVEGLQASVTNAARQAMQDSALPMTGWVSMISDTAWLQITNEDVRNWGASVRTHRTGGSGIIEVRDSLRVLEGCRSAFVSLDVDLFSLAPIAGDTTAEDVLHKLPLLKNAQDSATTDDVVEYINFKIAK